MPAPAYGVRVVACARLVPAARTFPGARIVPGAVPVRVLPGRATFSPSILRPASTPAESVSDSALGRVNAWWVSAGFLAGGRFLLLAPVFLVRFAFPFEMGMPQLALYTVHEYEEHDADRFRVFVNEHVGAEVLGSGAVFVINIGGVWLLDVIAIWLASTIDVGLGLIAVYASLVNAVVHLLGAAVTRRCNPGLITAALLLLPAGGVGVWVVDATGTVGVGYHALGIVVALALRGAIVGYVLRNRRRLAAG